MHIILVDRPTSHNCLKTTVPLISSDALRGRRIDPVKVEGIALPPYLCNRKAWHRRANGITLTKSPANSAAESPTVPGFLERCQKDGIVTYHWLISGSWWRKDGLVLPVRMYRWLVSGSEQWKFLKILDAAGKFVIIVALVQWFLEAGDREKERHYRAWAIVNSARGSTGDGGRKDALQDLNEDKVVLSVAPLTDAHLNGIELKNAILDGASLTRAVLVDAHLENANLSLADLTDANLAGAHLEGAELSSAKFINSNLVGANMTSAKLNGADLTGANLFQATLLKADLSAAKVDQVRYCGTLMPDGTTNNSDCPKTK